MALLLVIKDARYSEQYNYLTLTCSESTHFSNIYIICNIYNIVFVYWVVEAPYASVLYEGYICTATAGEYWQRDS